MAAASSWYAIIDGAQDERLVHLVRTSREHACLFSGNLHPAMAAAAPWLARIDPGEPLLATWQAHGRGKHWGLMCESGTGLEVLRRHFRRFLQAKLPDGTVALFRFYDPRVFATYVRSATSEELAPWFHGVRQFAVEDETGHGLIRFGFDGTALKVSADGVPAPA